MGALGGGDTWYGGGFGNRVFCERREQELGLGLLEEMGVS